MKIGILTLPLKYNYGGILQAYALQTVLKKMGYDPVILNRWKQNDLNRKPLIEILKYNTKLAIKKYFLRKDICKTAGNKAEIDSFLLNKLNLTQRIKSSADLHDSVSAMRLEHFVIGSDQVWRPKYAEDCLFDFYGQFLEHHDFKSLFSYSASFGTSEWEYSDVQSNRCKHLIKKFTSASVREDSAVDLCKEKFGIEVVQTLDPTMLIEKQDYIDLVGDELHEIDLFTYILNSSEEKNSAKSKILRNFNFSSYDANLCSYIKIEEWLEAFYKCKYVFTDSFHGCVFSIIFNKPFIAFANNDRGVARFTSLLKIFNLEDRLVFSEKELSQEKINATIDWQKVNDILECNREKSRLFLQKSIR